MSTAPTTSNDTGQTSSRRTATQPNNSPVTQTTPNAAQRLRTTMAAVRLAFTWLGVRKTLAPEQRTTAARASHADRKLLSASKLTLDTWAETGPVGEPVLGPFRNRTEALESERGWLLRRCSGRFRLNLAGQLAEQDFLQLDLVAGVVHVDVHEPGYSSRRLHRKRSQGWHADLKVRSYNPSMCSHDD